MKKYTFHTHPDESGKLIKCYHETKSMLLSTNFWIATIVSFPFEHFLWEKIWPFYLISHWLNL